jgi:hypothetical protein
MVKVIVKIKDDKYLEIFGDEGSIYIRAKVVSDPLPLPKKELHALRVIILAMSATKSRRPSSLILI